MNGDESGDGDPSRRRVGTALGFQPEGGSHLLDLVPQFIAPHQPFSRQILALATAHALLITLWLAAWTFLVLRASHALRTPRFKQTAGKITSAVLITLGIRSALT
jgi:threonine/homoserine/homoserine lactone efflux protein